MPRLPHAEPSEERPIADVETSSVSSGGTVHVAEGSPAGCTSCFEYLNGQGSQASFCNNANLDSLQTTQNLLDCMCAADACAQ